jgi:hypothetical protein
VGQVWRQLAQARQDYQQAHCGVHDLNLLSTLVDSRPAGKAKAHLASETRLHREAESAPVVSATVNSDSAGSIAAAVHA